MSEGGKIIRNKEVNDKRKKKKTRKEEEEERRRCGQGETER